MTAKQGHAGIVGHEVHFGFLVASIAIANGSQFDRGAKGNQIIFWHSDLPPVDAEPMGEHVVEAESKRVPSSIAHRGDLWNLCCEELMVQVAPLD